MFGLHYLQMSKENEQKREKNTYSQTGRLETPEELQLHHNHEELLFLTVLSLFAQCKMHVPHYHCSHNLPPYFICATNRLLGSVTWDSFL
jgi:hypothetical protein